MTATRYSSLAWVHACGRAALGDLFRTSAKALAGPNSPDAWTTWSW
jgi:hypothetical protein